jgi:deoxyinosine 3'endonuclease (endonuclease V)
MLVTQDHVRPVFVSPGHKVSLETAVDIVLGLTLHGGSLSRCGADRAARQRMK